QRGGKGSLNAHAIPARITNRRPRRKLVLFARNPASSKSFNPPNPSGDDLMSGPRRDSNDGTRGGPLHGRGGKSVDDNKKSGGGHGKPAGGNDDNARPPGGGVS
ncbi:MAG TPA: hypothetical protein VGU70_09160, partial [Methylobacterium sp.]|nr:hypothetical protein [Methylobacterium sp.]